MKKFICVILVLCSVLALAACAGGNAQPTTEATEATPSPYAGVVADPKTWYEEFTSIPVANSSMTTDELRDICVRMFKANLGFTWTPNMPMSYTYGLLNKTRDIQLPTGIAYSGLAYAAGNKDGATIGTIYKALAYYDKETGVMDVKAMGADAMNMLTSACAYGAQNAWNRVSNSHNLGSMDSYTIFDSNIVLVGPYTYDPYIYNYDFLGDERTATDKIIKHNGMAVMCESLAAMLPADGLYSTSAYHVMMCSIAPEVVRDANGVIDPVQSYMHVCEQAAAGTQGNLEDVIQSNGVALRQLGTIDRKVTFKAANNVKVAMLLVLLFYAVFTPLSTWLGELATNAGAHEFLVLAVTMISNFVLEYLYCRFIVYRNSCDTAVKNDQETKTIVEDNNGKEEKE